MSVGRAPDRGEPWHFYGTGRKVLEERLYFSKEAFVRSGHCECQTLLRSCLHQGGGDRLGIMPPLFRSAPTTK